MPDTDRARSEREHHESLPARSEADQLRQDRNAAWLSVSDIAADRQELDDAVERYRGRRTV